MLFMPPKGKKKARIQSLSERKAELLKQKAPATPGPNSDIRVKRSKSASVTPEATPSKKHEKSDYGLTKLDGPPPPIDYSKLINRDALELFDEAKLPVKNY